MPERDPSGPSASLPAKGEGELWVYGYASLIWRPDFEFVRSAGAWACDWERRFWQGSTDHRGVPGAPGRVATLVAAPGQRCWGRAFCLPVDRQEEIIRALDYREKGGYVREWIHTEFDSGERVEALMYRALPGNPNWLGPADLAAMAAQIDRAVGPSGPNREYILELAAALGEALEAEAELAELARRLR